MNAATRWKTIATIALAFSAGNLFATACEDGKSAHAEDEGSGGDGDGGDGDGDGDGDGNGDEGGGGDGDEGGTQPPEVTQADFDELASQVAELRAELSSLEREVESHKCYFEHITDYDNTGSTVDREDHTSAVDDCRI